MAGAGPRTRKSGAPSAKVGSIEVLRPRQIGPTIPSMRELGGMYAAAAGARGAERRTLEARAESGRQARAALLTARGGEKRGLAAAKDNRDATAAAVYNAFSKPSKPARPAATHLTSEKNEYTGAQFHRVIHGPTGKGVPYMAFGRKDQGERAAAGTKSGKTIDRLINGTTEQKLRAGEAMRRYGRIIDGTKHHDTERRAYHQALAARKTKAAEAERVAKAEARRERREAPKAAKPMKDPAQMHPAEINKHLDAIDKRSSKNASAFIAAGRGHERPTDYQHKTDPLSREAHAIESQRAALRYEIQRRYGPGAPSRMPKGFKPLKNAFAEG